MASASSLGRSDGFDLLMPSIDRSGYKPREYKVIYIQGRPHICTSFGCYMIGDGSDEAFVAFCSQNNIITVHDYDDLMGDDELHGVINKHFERMSHEDIEMWMGKYMDEGGKECSDNAYDDEDFKGFVLANMPHDERMAVLDHSSEPYSSDDDEDATRAPTDGYAPSETVESLVESEMNLDTETSTRASGQGRALKSSPIDPSTPYRTRCYGVYGDFDFAYSLNWTGSTFKKNLLKFMLDLDINTPISSKLVKEFDVIFNMTYDTDDACRGRQESRKHLDAEFSRSKIRNGILAKGFYSLESITIWHPGRPIMPSTSREDDEVNAVIYGANGLMEKGLKNINRATDIKVQLIIHGRSHSIGMYHPPTATVKDIINEVADLTGIGTDDMILRGVMTGATWEHDELVDDLGADGYRAYIVLRLRGGGGVKRKKVLVSDMKAVQNDVPCVKAVFGIEKFMSKQWLNSLTAQVMQSYKNEVEQTRGLPNQVNAMSRIREYVALKAGDVMFLH